MQKGSGTILFLALLVVCLATLEVCFASGGVRVLEFPADYSVGKLTVLTAAPVGYGKCDGKFLAEARGLVKLPSGRLINFEPSGAFYRHPEVLLKLPPDAFDFIELRFMPMTDEESALSVRVIPFVRHISALKGIDLDNSEITDKDLSQLGAMPDLEYLSAGNSVITGSCLSALKGCKKLVALRLGSAQVDDESLRYLQDFPRLARLGMTQVNLSLRGLEHVSKCQSITALDIDFNHRLDDKAVPLLLKLPKLSFLSLKETKISLQGLELLAKHGVVDIDLPKPFSKYLPLEQARIRKAFPHKHFSTKSDKELDDYTRTMFAPMTR